MLVTACRTNVVTDETGKKHYGQGYGDRWDNKTYPVPYTAQDSSISTLNSGRMMECATFKKCVACGDAVTEDSVSVIRKNGKVFSESGPFHEKCARLTARMCPHIAESKEYTFSVESWAEVKSEVLMLLTR